MTTEYETEMVLPEDTGETDIGKKLKMKRMSLGLDERQVATELKLPIEQVIALESNQFDFFRSITFARGYLKSYCRLLALDPRAILSAFDLQQATTEPTVKPVDKVNKQANFGDPIVIFISIVLVAVIVFVAVWLPTLDEDSNEENVESVVQEAASESQSEQVGLNADVSSDGSDLSLKNEEGISAPNAEASDASGNQLESAQSPTRNLDDADRIENTKEESDIETGLSAETKALLEEAGVDPEKVAKEAAQDSSLNKPVAEPVLAYNYEVEMSFSADCWTEVRDGKGKILYSGVKSKGSTLELNGNAPYRIVLGFARGVSSIKFKGEEFDFSSFIRKDLARFELK
ncbi:RodZ domain-containing protein [Marinomonas mediterranea]|jgi:Uncharacterized protein conserved in bacteria|uniref:Cytoskeleton protein RodZ-like C-terminal domain-containing protein n=1 Tax=Marinomonas mediterranea (strain ATCC 700492 / JCM 21426 / NBRC 103028 / MMB-1) TaxID=717774 RepID=F2JUT2_MARM1|nr:RodZ domain-containing protein [Marinomonas mediterranea]ADZ90497.1 hypothetical protein Marme_1224 [Marinomonas mediterranea MMB-1]WCN16676.1 DUF4115 domain-containing protein [Marinomonas mediterranea MMB-1]